MSDCGGGDSGGCDTGGFNDNNWGSSGGDGGGDDHVVGMQYLGNDQEDGCDDWEVEGDDVSGFHELVNDQDKECDDWEVEDGEGEGGDDNNEDVSCRCSFWCVLTCPCKCIYYICCCGCCCCWCCKDINSTPSPYDTNLAQGFQFDSGRMQCCLVKTLGHGFVPGKVGPNGQAWYSYNGKEYIVCDMSQVVALKGSLLPESSPRPPPHGKEIHFSDPTKKRPVWAAVAVATPFGNVPAKVLSNGKCFYSYGNRQYTAERYCYVMQVVEQALPVTKHNQK